MYIPMPLELKFLLPDKHPDKVIDIYIYTTALLENSEYHGVTLESKRLFFNLLFGCPKVDFDLDVLNKKSICLK